MITFLVEITTANRGTAPVRSKRIVTCNNACEAIVTALHSVPAFEGATVFCKPAPTNVSPLAKEAA